MGQIVETRELELMEINNTQEFDVSHLNKGIYYLVISSNTFQKSEKILVQ